MIFTSFAVNSLCKHRKSRDYLLSPSVSFFLDEDARLGRLPQIFSYHVSLKSAHAPSIVPLGRGISHCDTFKPRSGVAYGSKTAGKNTF